MDDGRDDLVLNRENVVQDAVVALRPGVRIDNGIDELGVDTHPLACSARARSRRLTRP